MTPEAIRSIVDPIIEELRGIRLALELAVSVQPGVDVEAECPHPPDARIDLSGMQEATEFFCKACRRQVQAAVWGA